MQYTFWKPSEALKPFVRCYWSLDVAITTISEPYRVVPQGCVELTFSYKTPYRDSRTSRSLTHSTIMGQQSRYYHLQALGNVGIFSVQFTPHGATMFFETPLNEVTNQFVSLNDFSENTTAILEERIILAKTNMERVQIIESYLLKSIRRKALDNFYRIEQVMNNTRKSRGKISIEQMCVISCLGKRQLGRIFQSSIGMTPKQYLKIIRFQNVLHTKQLNPEMSMTSLAYECGYHDQAHFIKDFKKITGVKPRQFFIDAVQNRCILEDSTKFFNDVNFSEKNYLDGTILF